MWLETGKLKGVSTAVRMDSKADDQDLVRECHRQRGMRWLTTTRRGTDKSPARQLMVQILKQQKSQRGYKPRGDTVEPMQGLIKDLFELERCGMRGRENKRTSAPAETRPCRKPRRLRFSIVFIPFPLLSL
jgi:hypothetical protein